MKLRQLVYAIKHGAVVRYIAQDPDGDWHRGDHWLVIYPDPNEPGGLAGTEQVQQRTVFAAYLLGLLDEDGETPLS